MKVLITGGAGFIGSNLVHHLASERPSWSLTVLDALTYAGNLQNISTLLDSGKVKFVKVDINDSKNVDAVFSEGRFDLVFHLAAESHVDRSIMSAAEFVRTNVLGTENMLSAMRKYNVPKFVHISTDEVYGSIETGRFFETTLLDPTSPYSASKAGSDLLALAYAKTYKLDVVVTRCTNNYGPYQFPEKFIPLFITNGMEKKALPLYGDGKNIRSWIYVTDHAAALLAAAEHGRAGEIYNIGGAEDAEIENREVAKEILDIIGAPQSLIQFVGDRPAHDLRYAVDCTKTKNELGWQLSIPFAEGLRRTVEWYKTNETWWRNIKSGEYKDYYEKNYSKR